MGLASTPQVLAVMAIGVGLILAILGVAVIAAVGKTVPTQLWDVTTVLSGALLGMLIPSPGQQRAAKAHRKALTNEGVKATAETAATTAHDAKVAANKSAQAAADAAEAPDKQGTADEAARAAKVAATRAAEAQATHSVTVQATAAAAMDTVSRPDWRIVFAVVLAFAAAGAAAWLYTGPGRDSQCLASVGTLTTTVAPPTTSTASTTSSSPGGTAPANTVTNVSTLTIGEIATPHPKSPPGSAADPVGTPQLLKTAAGSSTKCPAVATGDSLLALALGVLAAVLGILVPSFKLPETTNAPVT